jgi:hypothetical protein
MEQEQEIRRVLQETLEQYARQIQEEREPALKAELVEERRRREQLERRLNEVVEENGKHRQAAEETERHVAIKGVLQNLGVKKIEVAFRAVRDDVYRGEDGQLYGRGDGGSVGMKEFLARFVADNPEFLPARMAGGSGASGGQRAESESGPLDLAHIRPGMSAEEKERARREIARLAGTDFGGWL